jgi:predicted alpha/beta superfamily hydrolase
MSKVLRIRFDITVPASTPADAPIFLAGSTPSLGSWSPAGLQARPVGDGRYEAVAELPAGTALEFKVTRGNWSTAEVQRNGAPRQNRRRILHRAGAIRVAVAQWADVQRRVRGPVGLNEQHEVPSRALGGERRVMVHLPSGYFEQTRAYPLLLMHDGQNLFDDATSFTGVKWAADEAVDRLVERRQMEPIVVAGVWNSPNRMREYHPDRPLAKRYEQFLADELVPWLGQRYRLLGQRTGVAGSSMGGIISMHLMERRRELFTRAGVISPSVFAGRGVVQRLREHPLGPRGRRVWMDMGTLEGGPSAVAGLHELQGLLQGAGWKDELRCEVIQGGRHHEWDWAKRLPKVLAHLYPPR